MELKDKDWTTYSTLAEYNVPIAITTDHPVLPIEHLVTSTGFAVKAGLSEEHAWNSLTLNAAKHIGLDHRMGSIEVGKDADIVIWSSHPFYSFAKVQLTMVDGHIIYSSSQN